MRSTTELRQHLLIASTSFLFKITSLQITLEKVIERAGDETRTRDPQLGRLMLYQLSYSRIFFILSFYNQKNNKNYSSPEAHPKEHQAQKDQPPRRGQRRIRTSVWRSQADLQSAAFNHFAICPFKRIELAKL
jgi:hypothetical protein